VPADRRWIVAVVKSGKLKKWVVRHRRRDRRRRSRDVSSTARSRYMLAIPQATATGCQAEASGTRISTGPKWT
jgi:hypothetical protein